MLSLRGCCGVLFWFEELLLVKKKIETLNLDVFEKNPSLFRCSQKITRCLPMKKGLTSQSVMLSIAL